MGEEKFGSDTFLSAFSWRYGSSTMRRIFSEVRYRATWRRIWVMLAEAQAGYGLVSKEELEDLRSRSGIEHVNLRRSHELEASLGHDVMAEIMAFAEQSKVGGGKIHLGATSADIEDNADALRIKEALELVLSRLVSCLGELSKRIVQYCDQPCMGWTHLQPAEPTTLGYRLASYAQDLTWDLKMVEALLDHFVVGKGIKGAVGTSASYRRLLGDRPTLALEEHVMRGLGLRASFVTGQTYPRKMDYLVLSVLAGIAQSVHKFAFDLRILQSPVFGELSEPFGEAQVGSTAMPSKRNPVRAERACSLARYVGTLPLVAFYNASNMLLERTLDDSASRRIIIPEAFLAIDECMMIYSKLLRGLRTYPAVMDANLERFGHFSGTEALLMALTAKGANRQVMHEKLRNYSMKAWESVLRGQPNPMLSLLRADQEISKLVGDELEELMDPKKHVGDAPERARMFVREQIESILKKYSKRALEEEQPRF